MASLSFASNALPETPDETIRRLTAELHEAYEQQAAATEILEIINRSDGDIAPVFDAILEKAHSFCGADHGSLFLQDGEIFRAIASRGMPEAMTGPLREGVRANDSPLTRPLMAGEPFVHVHDSALEKHPNWIYRAMDVVSSHRTLLSIPLRKSGTLLGTIVAGRFEVRPFSDKQIALLQNFAAQAVIAMENARLLTETREALEQQTATAEVLQVINSSPGDRTPVFEAILEKARILCGAAHGSLSLYDGERFRAVAINTRSQELADRMRQGFLLSDFPHLKPLLDGARLVHVPDLAEIGHTYGARTALFVPLRKDDTLLGLISTVRREIRPFSDKEIALVENFAAQAVIAMENARLLTETREALEQQTATAEVLQIINSSPGDLTPVFETILDKAHTLCGAAHGIMVIREGEGFRTVAVNAVDPAFVNAIWQLGPPPPMPPAGGLMARIIQGEQIVHIADFQADQFLQNASPQLRQVVEIGDIRTVLAVPLRKDGAVIGMITAFRQEVRPFTDKQIALFQNFAAQAVIAMENARLLTETREALEQQTATAEVLQVINSSPGDLAPVFDAILEKAHTLCGAAHGALVVRDGDNFRAVATRGMPGPFEEHMRRGFPLIRGGPTDRLMRGDFVHILDLPAAAAESPPELARLQRQAAELAGTRTLLIVPLCKDGILLGYIAGYRTEIQAFSDKQIALLQNFAAQAVIAIENARLINETREALEQQSATAEVLQVINSSPGELTPVFDAILDKAHNLCGVEYGVLLTYDGELFWPVAMHGAPPSLEKRNGFRPSSGFRGLLRGERLLHIHDMAEFAAQRPAEPVYHDLFASGGIRTQLAVPLRKDGRLLGIIAVNRREVSLFSDKQIELLENFAAQAVIAMENARLLSETREALEQQPRRPRYCRSSTHRPATSPRCSTRFWRRRIPYAAPPTGIFLLLMVNISAQSQHTVSDRRH